MTSAPDSPSEVIVSRPKPKLRGVSHGIGAVVAIPFVITLYGRVPEGPLQLGAGVYGLALFMLLAVSGFYHVPTWGAEIRARLRLVDRSMIFVFVAGTYTPLLLRLGEHVSWVVMPAVWTAAGVGIIITVFFGGLPRFVTAAPYVVMGWGAVAIMPQVLEQLGSNCFWLITAGGISYTVGAVIYARRSPDPAPRIFGYHEIFHLLVLIAAAAHYLAIWKVIVPAT